MMGAEEEQTNKTLQERRISWENIPLLVGGEIKMTP